MLCVIVQPYLSQLRSFLHNKPLSIRDYRWIKQGIKYVIEALVHGRIYHLKTPQGRRSNSYTSSILSSTLRTIVGWQRNKKPNPKISLSLYFYFLVFCSISCYLLLLCCLGYYLPTLQRFDLSTETFVTGSVLVFLFSTVPTSDSNSASIASAFFRWLSQFPNRG